MDQIIVIAVTVAFVQAHHAVGVPAAVAHKAAEEIVTPGDAVDRAGCGRPSTLRIACQLRRDALIGIDHQHIVAGGVVLRALALNTIALPVGIDIDLNALAAGQFDGVVATAGVEQTISSAQLTDARQSGSRSAAFLAIITTESRATLMAPLRQIRLQ
jgi:hypothetical protein